MKAAFYAGVMSACLVLTAAAQTPSMDDVHEAATTSVMGQGTIQAIDPQKRTVTIRPSDGGNAFTVRADDVRNFGQLKVGQVVTATYYRSVALALQPAGSAEAGAYAEQDVARAEPGDLPGGMIADTVTVFAPIVAIDTGKNTVAILEPDGNHRIVAVQNPRYQALLPGLKKGDLVRLTFTEAVAIGVE